MAVRAHLAGYHRPVTGVTNTTMLKSLLVDIHFLICILIGWPLCCQPIGNHVIKLLNYHVTMDPNSICNMWITMFILCGRKSRIIIRRVNAYCLHLPAKWTTKYCLQNSGDFVLASMIYTAYIPWRMIVHVRVKQPWKIWVKFIGTKLSQNTTNGELSAPFVG